MAQQGKRTPQRKKDKIRKLLAEGLPHKVIAIRLDLSVSTIANFLDQERDKAAEGRT